MVPDVPPAVKKQPKVKEQQHAKKNPDPKGAPTFAEIRRALDVSGYPLEIRLLDLFDKAGMDPTLNPRMRVDQGSPTREVDLLAHFTRHVGSVRVTMRALVEAKSLERRARVVGFTWKPPPAHDLSVARMRIGGLPSFLDGQGAAWDQAFETGGLAEALDPLNEPPLCVQWAVLRPTKKHQPPEPDLVADHEDAYWKAIDTLARATSWRARSASSHLGWSPERPVLLFEYPVLVIATPTLMLFDATSKRLRRTTEFMLHRQFEVADGKIETRVIDVVAERGVPKLVDRYARCIERLERAAGSATGSLLDAARVQYETLREAATRPHTDALGARLLGHS